jgi:hypothetical protein
MTSLTTTVLSMSCSLLFRKSTVSMMTSYLLIIVLFAVPPAAQILTQLLLRDASATARISQLTFTSPFSASFSLPLSVGDTALPGNWAVFVGFLAFYTMVNATLLWSMLLLFNVRWRVRA